MKQSYYNFFYEYPNNKNKIIAYNARTNALAIIESEKYNKLRNFIENCEEINDKEYVKDLEKGEFIIEDTLNELDVIRFVTFNSRYSSKGLNLVIAPTQNCNFKCIYCYEKSSMKNISMSSKVQDSIINLILSQIKKIDSLNILWYGGEPLLELKIIEELSSRMIDICDQNSVSYTARMITNGYNLNREVSKKLVELRIKNIQVTLDGPEKVHDIRRPLVGGQGTFSKILKNLADSIDIMKNIVVRINVDTNNIGQIDDVLNSIEEYSLKNKIQLYLGHVKSTNNCYSEDICIKSDLFSKLNFEFERKLIENGFSRDLIYKYPQKKANYCSADSKNSFVIDPEGYVYKCWSDLGILDYAVSNIIDKNYKGNYSLLLNYMTYDPILDEKCAKCRYLPICGGGCPKQRVENNERCSEYKYVLEKYIKEIAVTLEENIK